MGVGCQSNGETWAVLFPWQQRACKGVFSQLQHWLAAQQHQWLIRVDCTAKGKLARGFAYKLGRRKACSQHLNSSRRSLGLSVRNQDSSGCWAVTSRCHQILFMICKLKEALPGQNVHKEIQLTGYINFSSRQRPELFLFLFSTLILSK